VRLDFDDVGRLYLTALPALHVDGRDVGAGEPDYFTRLHRLVADTVTAAALASDGTLVIAFRCGARLHVIAASSPETPGAAPERLDGSKVTLVAAPPYAGAAEPKNPLSEAHEPIELPAYQNLIDRKLTAISFTLDHPLADLHAMGDDAAGLAEH
jgi:hypothetical protein